MASLSGAWVTRSVVQFSRSVVSDSLQPHGLQQARPPCPSPTPRVYEYEDWEWHLTLTGDGWLVCLLPVFCSPPVNAVMPSCRNLCAQMCELWPQATSPHLELLLSLPALWSRDVLTALLCILWCLFLFKIMCWILSGIFSLLCSISSLLYFQNWAHYGNL